MPTSTMASRIRNATAILLFSITASESRLIAPETKMVVIKIVTTHRAVLLRSRLDVPESAFATVIPL